MVLRVVQWSTANVGGHNIVVHPELVFLGVHAHGEHKVGGARLGVGPEVSAYVPGPDQRGRHPTNVPMRIVERVILTDSPTAGWPVCPVATMLADTTQVTPQG